MTPRQAERTGATRAALISAAADLFAERGYGAVGTAEVVQRAGVSRGALYHHFADKRDLFRAVFEDAENRLAEDIAGKLAGAKDPYDLLVRGLDAFLDACLEPRFSRLALREAPTVLGWEEWRAIDARYGLGLVRAALGAGMDAGILRKQPIDALSHVILGAMIEAGLVIAHAEDPRKARRGVRRALVAVLDGLRGA